MIQNALLFVKIPDSFTRLASKVLEMKHADDVQSPQSLFLSLVLSPDTFACAQSYLSAHSTKVVLITVVGHTEDAASALLVEER